MGLTHGLATLLFLYSCSAYPDQECQPPRGTPSTQSFPFDIQMSLNPPDNFNPNTSVSIIMRGAMGKMFRDFQVQARAPYGSSGGMGMGGSSNFGSSGFGTSFNTGFGTGNVIGSWITMMSDARVISCQGYSDTIINSNRDSKQSTTLKWNAPRAFSGQVQFTFTIVSIDDQMWENQIKTMDIQQSGQWGQQGQGQWGQQGQGQGQWGQQGQGQGQWGQQGQGSNPWSSQGQQPWGSQGQGQGQNQWGQWGQQGQGQSNQWGTGQGGQGFDSTFGYGGVGHDGYGYTNSPYGSRYYNSATSTMVSWMAFLFSVLVLVYRHNF